MTLVLSVCTVIYIVPKEQCCQPIFRNLHCILILPCIVLSVCFILRTTTPFQPKLVDRFFYEVFLYVTCHIVVSISCSLLLYIVFCVTINLLSLFFLISDQYLGSIQQLPQL